MADTVKENACQMSADAWQAFTTREAAKAIGQCLEAKGRLDQPVKRLTMGDLERMADSAICRWVVLNSTRIRHNRQAADDLEWLLMA